MLFIHSARTVAFLTFSIFSTEFFHRACFVSLWGANARCACALFAYLALFIPMTPPCPMYVSTTPYTLLVKRPRYVFLIHGADDNAPSLVAWLGSSRLLFTLLDAQTRCSSSNAWRWGLNMLKPASWCIHTRWYRHTYGVHTLTISLRSCRVVAWRGV